MLNLPTRNKFIPIIFLLVYSVLLYFSAHILIDVNKSFNNMMYSFLSILTLFFIFISARFSDIKISSVFYLFLISFSVFIFGRHIYTFLNIFNNDSLRSIDDVYSLMWMTYFTLTVEQERDIFLITNYFLIFFTCGFLFNYPLIVLEEKRTSVESNDIIKAAFILFCFVLPVYFYNILQSVYTSYMYGYLSNYAGQATGERSSSIVGILFMLTISTLIVYSSNYKRYIFILIVFAGISGLTGGRGELITLLLTVFYIVNRKKNKEYNLLTLVFFISFLFFLMAYIITLTERGKMMTGSSFDLFSFFYIQGSTLGIVSFSIFADLKYQWFTLFQSFVPGMFRFYKFFVPEVQPHLGSVTTFISYEANSKMYLNGNGLGSSIVSELYILSMRSNLLFFIGSGFLGWLLGRIEWFSFFSKKWLVFLIAIMPIILFSPRNGFNVLLISAFYFLICTYIIRFFAAFIKLVLSKK